MFESLKIITDFSNEQLTEINGTLLIDTSNLGLAQHLYMYLLDEIPEIITIELKETLELLFEITGEIVNEDILDNIFSGFCIGK